MNGTVRRVPPIWIGLVLAFASALVTNTAYSLEHDAAAALPPLSPRRPVQSVKLLLGDRRWLAARPQVVRKVRWQLTRSNRSHGGIYVVLDAYELHARYGVDL